MLTMKRSRTERKTARPTTARTRRARVASAGDCCGCFMQPDPSGCGCMMHDNGQMLDRTYPDQVCSIARALEVVGERWSVLIVRDAFLGRERFSEFQRSPRDRAQRPHPAARPPRRRGRARARRRRPLPPHQEGPRARPRAAPAHEVGRPPLRARRPAAPHAAPRLRRRRRAPTWSARAAASTSAAARSSSCAGPALSRRSCRSRRPRRRRTGTRSGPARRRRTARARWSVSRPLPSSATVHGSGLER